MKKRLLALFMVLCVAVGLLPVSAFADGAPGLSPELGGAANPHETQPTNDPSKDGYTLTYRANGGYWGTAQDPEAEKQETNLPMDAWHPLSYAQAATAPVHAPILNGSKQTDVLFLGWSLDEAMQNVVLDKHGSPTGLLSSNRILVSQNHVVYAVWAEDSNRNGKPDCQESPITVKFDPRPGTCAAPAEFTLYPFPDRLTFYYPPAVTPPGRQTFVNWTLQADPTKTLRTNEAFYYDRIFQMAGGQSTVTFTANYQAQDTITIIPASMTVYMGGSGYQGVVSDGEGHVVSQTENGFPVPGFSLQPPANLPDHFDVSKLVLKYKNQNPNGETSAWRFVKYGQGDHNLYQIVPQEGTQSRPLRIQFTNPSTGDIFPSDSFDAGRNLNQTLTMEVYGEGIQPDQVVFEYDGQPYGVAVGPATLTVRGTSKAVRFSNEKAGSERLPKLTASDATTYTMNDGRVVLADTHGVALLFDDILNTAGTTDRTDLLKARAETYFKEARISASAGNIFAYELKYLDLVDTNNGNAWVKADRPVTISWPLPAGADPSTVQLLHYNGVNRSASQAEITQAIQTCTVEKLAVTVENGFAVFSVEPGSFSPFALVWETKDPAPGSVTLTYYPNGGSGSPRQVTYTQGSSVEVSNNRFRRSGYVFTGWNTAANGRGTGYAPGDAVTLHRSMELYAQWKPTGDIPQDYTLHYVTNGGKPLPAESKSSPWIKSYKDLPTPVRSGYTFEGWYWDLHLTKPVTGKVKVDEASVSLYAKWSGGQDFGPDSTGVSRWLETGKHNAFVSGYPNGMFGPDQNMTRAEAAQMFYALLRNQKAPVTKSFSDVPSSAWYAKAVNTLSGLGMLDGYPDGTFRPDAPITRAEFAAAALSFAHTTTRTGRPYTDVNMGAWYYPYVTQATAYGWISGYPDGAFRPNSNITRAEVCVIVNNMLGRMADQSFIDKKPDKLARFADLSKRHWAYSSIMEAANSHSHSSTSSGERWNSVK